MERATTKIGQTKLGCAVRSLTKVEFNRFIKFLDSPYFNSNKVLIPFIAHIYQVEKDLAEWKADLCGILEIDQEDDAHLRKAMSEGLKLFERFLAIEYYSQNNVLGHLYTLRELSTRSLEKLIPNCKKNLTRALERWQYKSSEYYHLLGQANSLFYHVDKVNLKRVVKSQNIERVLVNRLDISLTNFYLEAISIINSLMSWSRLIKIDLDFNSYDRLIEEIEEKLTESQTETLEVQLLIYRAFRYPDSVENYLKLKSAVIDNLRLFPPPEAKEIFDSTTNYCLNKINTGDHTFVNELFEVYKFGLKSQTLILNESISPWTFKNIISIAIRNNNIQWAEQFHQEYQNMVKEEHSESIKSLCAAQINFYKKNWNEVFKSLQEVEFNEFSLKVNAEIYEIASYYELDEYEQLTIRVKNFGKYLNRQVNISRNQLLYPKNFLKYIKRLSHPKYKKDAPSLKEEIVNAKNVASKTWLLEKVDELLPKEKMEK